MKLEKEFDREEQDIIWGAIGWANLNLDEEKWENGGQFDEEETKEIIEYLEIFRKEGFEPSTSSYPVDDREFFNLNEFLRNEFFESLKKDEKTGTENEQEISIWKKPIETKDIVWTFKAQLEDLELFISWGESVIDSFIQKVEQEKEFEYNI